LNVETQLWSNNIISIGGPDYIANAVSVIDGGIFS